MRLDLKPSKLLGRGRLTRRLMGTFFIIVAVLAAVGMMVTTSITAKSLEARAESQLTNDEALVRINLDELEEHITVYSQLLASTEKLTAELAQPTVSRSLTISILSNIRRHRMRVQLFQNEPTPGTPNASLIQKGFLGIRTISLTKVLSDGRWEAWIESVAPIEAKRGVERVVMVSFMLGPEYLKAIRRRIGSDITIILPNLQSISTLPPDSLEKLVSRVRKQGLLGHDLREYLMFSTKLSNGPAKTLVSPFRVNLKQEGLLLLTMPMGDLQAAKMTIFFKGLISTLIILSAASLIYLSLIRRVTKPLEELSTATHEIARGRLDLQVSVDTRDEVGELASSFNVMVQRLKESREEIEEWNRTLEKRVEDRTMLLEKAKGELKATNDQLVKALEEIRDTQDKMIRTEKLAALGQMASTIAHEIQNPLAGMRGALEVVLKEQRDKPHADILKKVLEQIDRLSQTTNRLLSFARPASPQQTPTDLTDLIEKTRFFVAEQANKKGVEIVLDLEPLDRLISIDPQLTNQAFLNIALNAIQAMEEGGILTISSKWDSEEHTVTVTFTDTGAGMAPEVRDRVFNPFFTTKPEGTGLGLYVVKDIIEQQGGSVKLSSVPGQGTMVTITIPARESPLLQPAS